MTDRTVRKSCKVSRARTLGLAATILLLVSCLGAGGCGKEPPPAPPPARSGPYAADGAALAPPGPLGTRPNLLLLVLPELRADRCGEAVADPSADLLPRLAELAAAGDAFGHAVTPSPEPSAALASLLTGLQPVRHTVTHADPVPALAPGFVTLGEILRASAGYATRAFVADARLARAATFWQGFDVDPLASLASASTVLAPWWRSVAAEKPWAAVVVAETLGSGYASRTARAPLESAAYDERVRAANQALSALLDALAALPAARGTLVLVTSTGGVAFGEHGISGSGRDLHDEQVRIPLVLGGSVYLAGEGLHLKTASLVDVLPTLLDLLDLPAPQPTDGVSLQRVLVGEARRGPVISEEREDGANSPEPAARVSLVSVRSLSWKYIVRYDVRAGTVIEQVHDLFDDPGEKQDLAREGRLVGAAFDSGFCEVVEHVRDGIWAAAQANEQLVDAVYGQGARLLSGRPPPCGQ